MSLMDRLPDIAPVTIQPAEITEAGSLPIYSDDEIRARVIGSFTVQLMQPGHIDSDRAHVGFVSSFNRHSIEQGDQGAGRPFVTIDPRHLERVRGYLAETYTDPNKLSEMLRFTGITLLDHLAKSKNID